MSGFSISAAPTPEELARIGFQVGADLEFVDDTVFVTFRSFNAVNPLFMVAIRPAAGSSFEGTELADFVIDVGEGVAALVQYWDKRVAQPDEVAPLMLDDLLPQAMKRYPTLAIRLHREITRDAGDWLS